MDSRIAILGANGTGKSTLLNLITSVLQPVEGTISKHASLKLAKYSQHSADQLPYNQSPLEHFQQLFAEKFPEKDLQVYYSLCYVFCRSLPLGVACTIGSIRPFGLPSDIANPTTLRWLTQPVCPLGKHVERQLTLFSVVFSQLSMEHPHILLLGEAFVNSIQNLNS